LSEHEIVILTAEGFPLLNMPQSYRHNTNSYHWSLFLPIEIHCTHNVGKLLQTFNFAYASGRSGNSSVGMTMTER
jgi:hypothetical protein